MTGHRFRFSLALLALTAGPSLLFAQMRQPGGCPWSLQLIQQQQHAIWMFQQQSHALQMQLAHQQAGANHFMMMQARPQAHGYMPPFAARNFPRPQRIERPNPEREYHFRPPALYMPRVRTTTELALSRVPRFRDRVETVATQHHGSTYEWGWLEWQRSLKRREGGTWPGFGEGQIRKEEEAWSAYLLYLKRKDWTWWELFQEKSRDWFPPEYDEYQRKKEDWTWMKHEAPGFKFKVPPAKHIGPPPLAKEFKPRPQPMSAPPPAPPPNLIALQGKGKSSPATLEMEIKNLNAMIRWEKSLIKMEVRCTGCHVSGPTGHPSQCPHVRSRLPLPGKFDMPIVRRGGANLPMPMSGPSGPMALAMTRPNVHANLPMPMSGPTGPLAQGMTRPTMHPNFLVGLMPAPIGMQPTGDMTWPRGIVPAAGNLPRKTGKNLARVVHALAMPTNTSLSESRSELMLLNPIEAPSTRATPDDEPTPQRVASSSLPFVPESDFDGPTLPPLSSSLLLLTPMAPWEDEIKTGAPTSPPLTNRPATAARPGPDLDLSRPSSLLTAAPG